MNREERNARARARYAANKEKEKSRHKEWAIRNHEHLRLYEKQRYAENPERKREQVRRWRRNHPEYTPMACKRWVRNNPQKARDADRAAKHRRRRAAGAFSPSDIREIRKMQRGRCAYCRAKISGKDEHIDHIVALINGGTNNRQNIQLLCEKCNKRKSAKHPIDFAQSMGMLL